jgi:uncharacterized repeat protein (TIGR01451 family)
VGTAGSTYYISLVISAGDPPLVNNHLPIDPPPAGLTKVANVSTAKRGDIITFTISAGSVPFNPATLIDTLPAGLSYVGGSATINGVAVNPTISGNTITFANVNSATHVYKLVLKAAVNAAAKPGTMTNNVALVYPLTGATFGTAKASVEILPEAIFDCTDIIGKVFEDKNRNGYEDDGEPGLPGVRLVTVNGVLITTDAYGRYHIGCADMPNAEIGSNFILKLDTRTLPTGYRVTTENPKTIRLTPGKMVKMNFGASISRVIRFDLTDQLFHSGQDVNAIVGKLTAVLDASPSVLRLTYYAGGDGQVAAQQRLKDVKTQIEKRWSTKPGRYDLNIEAQVIGAK